MTHGFDVRAIAVVGVGAALGGILRFLVTQAAIARGGIASAPLATFLINLSGSFAIGVVIEMARSRAQLDPWWRLFLATGVLGGYTTFATFSFEAFDMVTSGRVLLSTVYGLGSVGLGVVAALLGVATARVLAALP